MSGLRAYLPTVLRPRLTLDAQSMFEGRGWIALLLVIDALALAGAAIAAGAGVDAAAAPRAGEVLLWLSVPVTLAALALLGGYRPKLDPRIVDELGLVLGAVSTATMGLIAVATLAQSTAAPAHLLTREWLFGILYVFGFRATLLAVRRRARAEGLLGQPTLIMGAGRVGASLEERLRLHPELGLRVIGYADSDPPSAKEVPNRKAPVLGPLGALPSIVRATGVQRVLLAFLHGPGSDRAAVPIIRECERLGVEVSLVPRLYEETNLKVRVERLGPMTLLRLRRIDPKGWQFVVKYGVGRLAAAGLLVLAAPAMLLIALAVKLSSPGPVLFRQPRIGLDDREFEMLKFRTMTGSPEADGEADAAWADHVLGKEDAGGEETQPPLPGRRTRVGSLLRKSSLDELPQLINVVRGEMALVGPRPERTSYVREFQRTIAGYGDRHRVKSGLTGLAQVQGLRGATSLEERVAWDNHYIENWSLLLDVKVLLLTGLAVLRGAE